MTLIEAARDTFRRLHDSPRTEEAYLHWIRAFIRFHGRRHPREMGGPEIVRASRPCTDPATGRLVLVTRTCAPR